MNERRKVRRARTILGGVIAFNGRQSTVECSVRNLSTAGARIHFINTALLPDEFDLTISRKQLTWRVRTIWRGEDTAGVAFFKEAEDSILPLNVSQKIEKLKAQNRALRRRVADLSEGAI